MNRAQPVTVRYMGGGRSLARGTRRGLWLLLGCMGLVALTGLGGCERKGDPSTEHPPPADTKAPGVAAGGTGSSNGNNQDAGPPVIVVLGDSLTEGYGVPAEVSYPAQLQERLIAEGYPHRVVNAGVSGDTSAGGLARTDWVLRQRVDLLIVELGANDGLRGVDPAATHENLARIIEKGRAAGVEVVLAGMIMPENYGRDYKRRYDAVFPALAEEFDLPLIPFILEGVAGRRDLNLPDGIHPTGEGYAIVAETVWEVIEPLLGPS